MIRPANLKIGDTVGLISTARKISRHEIAPAVEIIDEWGLKPLTAPHLFEVENQFAGSDEQRLMDMQAFLDNPDIRAIICVRGGYGTVRIIDHLNFENFAANPKWVCGYSDVTVLHNKLTQLGYQSLHSSMPINFTTNTPAALNSIKSALYGNKISYQEASHPFNRQGSTNAPITGGNLSMLYSQTGSSTKLQTKGKILFIEDLDEYLYHIDRMMYNLKRNYYFEELAGMIVGGLSDMNDNEIPFGHTAEEIVRDHLQEYSFPVCFGFPSGHLADNRSLIFGRKAYLEVANQTHLHFHE